MEEETDIEIDEIFNMISRGLVIPAMMVNFIL